MREASPHAWEDVKAGVSNALEEFGKAVERARARFKEQRPALLEQEAGLD